MSKRKVKRMQDKAERTKSKQKLNNGDPPINATGRGDDREYHLIMTRDETCSFIGISPAKFDKDYRYRDGFPRVKNGKEDRFPRDPVVKWIAENWEVLA